MKMDELHVYTDDEEFVIATSPEDADAVMREVGATPPQPAEWRQMNDAKPFTFDDGVNIARKTCGEWARARGRGYFCTANY
jgi:hypothetical protein